MYKKIERLSFSLADILQDFQPNSFRLVCTEPKRKGDNHSDIVACSPAYGSSHIATPGSRRAIELYRSTQLSCAEICRICKVTTAGFRRYLSLYHRPLLLARYDIICSKEEAVHIKLNQLRGQFPATRAKYREAIEACESLDYIECNVSQIARHFGVNGTNLGRQLRTHYPGIIKWREEIRKHLSLNDNLPRGTRKVCKEQYAEAVKLLRADRYITVQEVAERCNVSYSGLEQHLIFYHKKLVENRIKIRERAVRQQRRGTASFLADDVLTETRNLFPSLCRFFCLTG